MEESINKLKQFFNQISWAQTEADQFRVKILRIPGGKRKIFLSIDKHLKGQISSNDICNFCQQKGIKVNEQTQQIVGRYFRNWKQTINFDQFSDILKPRNRLCQFDNQDQTEDPIKMFIFMVNLIIKSFECLQVIRQKLAKKSYFIIQHFRTKYQSQKGINKKQLKKFMIDQDMYSKAKYHQIQSYIFGNFDDQIPWENLFRSNKTQQKVIKQQDSMHWQQQKKRLEDIQIEKDYNNIDQVLDKIQQIQQQLKQKKMRLVGCQSQPSTPKKQKQVGKVGKVVTQNVKHIKLNQKQNLDRNAEIQEKDELENTLNEIHLEKNDELPDVEDYYKNKYLNKSSSCRIEGIHKKGFSEAQLKINQIEKRAMDKFLSKRQQLHLPNDNYIPFYYSDKKQNLQFLRDRSFETIERRIQRASNKEYRDRAIYSRNKVSRPLYSNYGFMQRPVSPDLMRY